MLSMAFAILPFGTIDLELSGNAALLFFRTHLTSSPLPFFERIILEVMYLQGRRYAVLSFLNRVFVSCLSINLGVAYRSLLRQIRKKNQNGPHGF